VSEREIWRKTVEREMAERHCKKENVWGISLGKERLRSGKSFRTRVNIRKAFQRWDREVGRSENGCRGHVASAPYASNIGFALVNRLIVFHFHFSFCFPLVMIKRHLLYSCIACSCVLGAEQWREGCVLFGLISNINSDQQCFSEIP